MEKIHEVFMLSCIKHTCFNVFSPFGAYFYPHVSIAEKGPKATRSYYHVFENGQNWTNYEQHRLMTRADPHFLLLFLVLGSSPLPLPRSRDRERDLRLVEQV